MAGASSGLARDIREGKYIVDAEGNFFKSNGTRLDAV